MTIGTNIRKLRLKHKLTQGQLAHRAGIHKNYVGMLERGDKENPSIAVLKRIAKALKTTPDKLF